MGNHKTVSIAASDYELELCPEVGGCMTAFRYQGKDVMRAATDEYWQHEEPRAAASFPLVPFSNRIDGGKAEFEGRTYNFPINMPPEPHSIHGDGWRSPWTVEGAEPARAVLFHSPTDTPFPYASRQIFELTEAGLNASLELTNTGDETIPAGFGHHPYFPRTEGLTLQMPTTSVWLPDERFLPTTKKPVPEEWDFRTPQRLAPLILDYDFTDGHGPILMHWPETGVRLQITSDPIFSHVVVYVPEGRDFVCVEPVTNLGNGVNLAAAGRTDTGIRALAPGETMQGSMQFQVIA